MKTKVVILGAGYAGILCANRLEKQNKQIEITLISDGKYFQERIRFHEVATGRHRKQILISDLLRKNIILQKGKVTKIEPNKNQVLFQSDLLSQTIQYDYLVVAIGSAKIKPFVTGENSIQSQTSLTKFLSEKNPNQLQNVCILGGGLTGIELATEWKEQFPNAKLTLLETKSFGTSFSKRGARYLKKQMKTLGIDIKENVSIKTIQSEEIEFEDQSTITFDSLMNCTGFQPESFFSPSDLVTNNKDQIYVDRFLRSKQFPNLFAVGDVAKLEHSILRMGCVTALPMGAYVADTISDLLKNQNPSEFQFQFFGRCVSLGRKNGLIQLTYGDDSPRDWILTGKLAAWIKERVNRFTLFSLRMEKLLPFRFYVWPKGDLYTKHRMQTKNNQDIEKAIP